MGERYGVLISGDLAENGYEEFWYDVVLVREALINNGFAANNIFVLYGNGNDYFNVNRPNPRYRPNPAITNFAASSANVTSVFNGLANGTGGFPQMTDRDLLFIWTFDHGSTSAGHALLCLMDTNMQDTAFATLVDQVPYAYRIFCMQQCFSGGFIDDLSNDRTVVLTACSGTEVATPADTENEVVNGVTYHHGEFNFHLLSALNGQTVTGTPVNADANGNGFVTMQEVFNYIQANESKPETPQYGDGSRNLGDRLHLSFADIFMRDNLQDTGMEPSPGSSISRSPDINHYRQQLLDPQATLGSPAAQGQDNLFENIEIGQSNFLYVRLQNRGYSTSGVEIDLYWTPPSTLPTPNSWNLIGTINEPSIAVDEFKVAGPLEWPANQIPAQGHYCFVGVLGNVQDPRPDTTAINNVNDFYAFIRDNNNVVWKNFDVYDAFAGGYQKFEFQIQGWPGISYAGDLEIELSQLPKKVKTEIKLLNRLVEEAKLVGLSLEEETTLYSSYQATSQKRAALRNIQLQPGDCSWATLALTWPQGVQDGAYEVSVLQKINGKEMGRVTKRIVVGDHPYVANRNTREVHEANCEWVLKMSSRNKIAYRELQLALNHGYNGCHYCLPESDTG